MLTDIKCVLLRAALTIYKWTNLETVAPTVYLHPSLLALPNRVSTSLSHTLTHVTVCLCAFDEPEKPRTRGVQCDCVQW